MKDQIDSTQFQRDYGEEKGLRLIRDGRDREWFKERMVAPGVPPMHGCHKELHKLCTAQGISPG